MGAYKNAAARATVSNLNRIQREAKKRALSAFAENLAEGMDFGTAAWRAGRPPSEAYVMFKKICRDLGRQAK